MPDPIYQGIIRDRGGAVHNVRGYGAAGDGTTPDQAAFVGPGSAQAAGDAVVVPAGTYRFAATSISTYTLDKALRLERGAVLAPDAGVNLVITGQVEAGQWQIFGGAGTVQFGAAVPSNPVYEPHNLVDTPDVLVDWFGASNDRQGDATDPINRTIAALPDTGNLVFGKGSYRVTGSLSTFTKGKSIQIRGQGVDTTRIVMEAGGTARQTLFSFDPNEAGTHVWNCSVRDLTITSPTPTPKTAIRVVDVHNFANENLLIHFVVPGDQESIGLNLCGWDESVVRNVTIYAGRPIFVGANPYPGQPSGLDHWSFTDLSLYASFITNPVHSLVEVEAGCNLSNVEFEGRQTWVGGNGGFYWDSSTVSTGNGINLAFTNVRWEGREQQNGRAVFHLHPFNFATPVTFRNVYVGIRETETGFFLRKVQRATFIGVIAAGQLGSWAYNLDGSCDYVLFLGFGAHQGCVPQVTGMTKVFAAGHHVVTPPETEQIRYYVSTTHVAPDPYFSLLDHDVWTKVVDIASGTEVNIWPALSIMRMAQVMVAFEEGGGGPAGGGHFLVTSATPNGTGVRLGGTPNTAGTQTPGTVSVLKRQAANAIVVRNDLGSTRRFSIIVYFSRSNPLA